MKLCLASLSDGSRDGMLVAARPDDGGRFFRCIDRYTRLLNVLEDWDRFTADVVAGVALAGPALDETKMLCVGPVLRRTWQALYASAFGNRAVRVLETVTSDTGDDAVCGAPLMYQGASDHFLGSGETIDARDNEAELDLEPEIAVITEHVPQGTTALEAHRYIRLVILLNDFTYRTIVRQEREARFGFVQGKPVSSMAPFACTPLALGECWRGGVLWATAVITRNGESVGRIATHEMQYTFHELIQHAAATRSLSAGTIISSGTVSSSTAEGAASLVELRALQRMRGEPLAPFLHDGDEIAIDIIDDRQRSLFGRLNNRVRCSVEGQSQAAIEGSRKSA